MTHRRDSHPTVVGRLRAGPLAGDPVFEEAADRIERLEATLRVVRAAIIDKADDTFWLSSIETVVDRIDAELGGYADDQAELLLGAAS